MIQGFCIFKYQILKFFFYKSVLCYDIRGLTFHSAFQKPNSNWTVIMLWVIMKGSALISRHSPLMAAAAPHGVERHLNSPEVYLLHLCRCYLKWFAYQTRMFVLEHFFYVCLCSLVRHHTALFESSIIVESAYLRSFSLNVINKCCSA